MSPPVVLINVFEVSPGADDEFVSAWESARDHLEQQPGYVDTALHRALAPDADFRYVNVARWESPGHFDAARRSPEFRESAKGLAGFASHPALYEVLRT